MVTRNFLLTGRNLSQVQTQGGQQSDDTGSFEREKKGERDGREKERESEGDGRVRER